MSATTATAKQTSSSGSRNRTTSGGTSSSSTSSSELSVLAAERDFFPAEMANSLYAEMVSGAAQLARASLVAGRGFLASGSRADRQARNVFAWKPTRLADIDDGGSGPATATAATATPTATATATTTATAATITATATAATATATAPAGSAPPAQLPLSVCYGGRFHMSHCGYCGRPGRTSATFGMSVESLTCGDYQRLIDRNWRRSGTYLYRPDMRRTCCPQYTIRTDAAAFEFTKTHKRTLANFRRQLDRLPYAASVSSSSSSSSAFELACHRSLFRHEPPHAGPAHLDVDSASSYSGQIPLVSPSSTTSAASSSSSAASCASGTTALGRTGSAFMDAMGSFLDRCADRLDIRCEPASFSEAKYRIYSRYQQAVHGDSAERACRSSFFHFLVESPLLPFAESDAAFGRRPVRADFGDRGSGSDNHSDNHSDGETGTDHAGVRFSEFPTERGVDVMGVTRYGLFHMNYYLDGELVAVGVVDVLPRCVSAVYFMYDPAFSAFGLGKLSALMEVYLTRLLCAEAALPDLAFYYMGYYIHAQPKMRYKAGYGPAALLEPFQQTWVPLDRCAPYLDRAAGGVFSGFLPSARHGGLVPTWQCYPPTQSEIDDYAERLRGTSGTKHAKCAAHSAHDVLVLDGSARMLSAPAPGFADPLAVTPADMDRLIMTTCDMEWMTAARLWHEHPSNRAEILGFCSSVGVDMLPRMILSLDCGQDHSA